MAIARFWKMISGFGDGFNIWIFGPVATWIVAACVGNLEAAKEIKRSHFGMVQVSKMWPVPHTLGHVGTASFRFGFLFRFRIASILAYRAYSDCEGPWLSHWIKWVRCCRFFSAAWNQQKQGRVGASVTQKWRILHYGNAKKNSKNMLFLILIRSVTLSLWSVMLLCSKTMVLSALW